MMYFYIYYHAGLILKNIKINDNILNHHTYTEYNYIIGNIIITSFDMITNTLQ